jgi:hypothetical protein
MTPDQLIAFIEEKMSMQHVYQPLLIKVLVESGGSATVRQLAQAILELDEAQIAYYSGRIKDMPVPVLKRHGVLDREGDLVSLSMNRLSMDDRCRILMLCEQKIREFMLENGSDVWSARYESDPVSLSSRYEVLKRANKRCELCGVKDGDEDYDNRLPLHVDHIVPRSKGGSNEIQNLQVLCMACNLGKSNRDDTDFRSS